LGVASPQWTHPSVVLFAGNADPVAAIVRRARDVVNTALDLGWTGPPFDPIALAELLRIAVIPRDDVAEARTVPAGNNVRIEFNPNRPPNRVRYSVAHEIAHTFFADCAQRVRHRLAHDERSADAWQLEALCNIAAAELLMPAGSLGAFPPEERHIESLIALRKKFAVSIEALLIRLTRSVPELPCATFCASRIERGPTAGRYRVDYIIGSSAWNHAIQRGQTLPHNTAVAECIAIGHTASAVERWGSGAPVRVEAVAIPGYPGARVPRVVGMLARDEYLSVPSSSPLRYVRGDATRPRGPGPSLIVHVVNDATPNWGGSGFAASLRRKWPRIQQEFRAWALSSPNSFRLGQVHVGDAEDGVFVASLVAQRGYGPSARPRIRYAALAACLQTVKAVAARDIAGVHMPRIGAGLAGGSWHVISDLVVDALCATGVPVTVYDLPGATIPTDEQQSLDLRRP
jgi:O-acetyl-ADP-ribose deacetylase (regulator of RNase III)